MSRARIAVAGLALSAAAFVGLVTREGYTDTAVIPTMNDRPTVGFGSTFHSTGTAVRMGDKITPVRAVQLVAGHLSDAVDAENDLRANAALATLNGRMQAAQGKLAAAIADLAKLKTELDHERTTSAALQSDLAAGRRRLSVLTCLVSCDHVPRRSIALFRAKAVLDQLIVGFPPRSSTHRNTSSALSIA
jgi:hypothetical protein